METLDDIKAKARQKVEAEITNTDDYTGQIGMFLLSWIEYADNAAELIMTEGKDIKGAFEAIRDYASKHKTNNYACVAPAKGMELVLEYFGQADPIGVIEGGLMYKFMQDAMTRYQPQYVEAQVVMDDEPPKPQPVAEEPKPKKDLSALSALSLENLGL